MRLRRAHAQQHDEFAAFARRQHEVGLEGAATVLTLRQEIRAFSLSHGPRIGIRPVNIAEEILPHRFVAHDRGAGQGHPGPAALIEVRRVELEVRVRRHAQDPVDHVRLDDELGVLQVRKVVGHIPTTGELAVGEDGELPLPLRFVGDLQPPVLKQLPEWHKIGRFRFDAGIARIDDCIGRAMAARALVAVQRLADRLP